MRLRFWMVTPLSIRCSWNRRTSSGVAVSGERFRYAANRLQARTCPFCVWGTRPRETMSSIMRWRSGEMLVGLVGESLSVGDFQSLSAVAWTSILKLGLPTPIQLLSQLVTSSDGRRYRGSDLVP
jgi:hypothetical protein